MNVPAWISVNFQNMSVLRLKPYSYNLVRVQRSMCTDPIDYVTDVSISNNFYVPFEKIIILMEKILYIVPFKKEEL